MFSIVGYFLYRRHDSSVAMGSNEYKSNKFGNREGWFSEHAASSSLFLFLPVYDAFSYLGMVKYLGLVNSCGGNTSNWNVEEHVLINQYHEFAK